MLSSDYTSHLLAILIFLGVATVFYWPHVEGKQVHQSDLIQYQGMTQEILEIEKEIGRRPLWTNSMFGGMPTYQISPPDRGNYLGWVNQILQLGSENPIGIMFTCMIGFYLLLFVLRVHWSIAIIGSIAFGLSTYNIVLFESGHITKLKSVSFLPLVTAGLILTYRGRFWWGFFLFALGFGLNLMANHVQMTYYFFLTVPLFLLAKLIDAHRKNNTSIFLKGTGVLALAFFLALGSSLSSLWPTYEYSKETIRGKNILADRLDLNRDSRSTIAPSSGLDWEFAMEWSNGMIDLLTCYIPGAAGISSQARLFSDAKLYQELADQRIQDVDTYKAPMYWGNLPFTNGPPYFGAVILFFFIIGMFQLKGPLKWWLTMGTILLVFISLGKNFHAFNVFLFENVPLFDRFRSPNSSLVVASFLVPLLGALGLNEILKSESSDLHWTFVRRVGIRLLIITLFLAFIGPYLFEFSSRFDPQYEVAGFNISDLISDRRIMLRRDGLRSGILIALCLATFFAYTKNKINRYVVIGIVGTIIFFDLWDIDRRFLRYDSFVERNENHETFVTRPVDKEILLDPDPNFRVLDWTVNTFNTSSTSYYHKSLGGYHAAKLRRYQDLIDRYLSKGDRTVIDMLNTRYVIQPDANGTPSVFKNDQALGNAWPVEEFIFVESAQEEFSALDHVKAEREAVVHREFDEYVESLVPDASGSIELTHYIPDHHTYSTTSEGEMFAVFSEIWYGPDLGWQAFIDGQPVEHIRVNYVLRALRVPPGNHIVEFRFAPKSFYQGRVISRISSLLIIFGFLWFVGITIISTSSRTTVFGPKLDVKKQKAYGSRPSRVKSKVLSKKTALGSSPVTTTKQLHEKPEIRADTIDDVKASGRIDFSRSFKVLAGISLIVILFLSVDTGRNADDEYQTDYSEKLVDFYSSGGEDKAALYIENGNMHLYGGFFDLITGAINRVLGFDMYSPGYHRTRHLFNAILGFVAILFAALLAKQIAGWRAAILTLIFLMLSPRFLGHSLMNPKDIPFAAGYIMAIFFMVRFFQGMPKPTNKDILGIVLGIGIAFGTRAGGLILIGYLFVFSAVHYILKSGYTQILRNNRSALAYLKYSFLISIGGYLFAILFWPAALIDPLGHPFKALSQFSDLDIYIRLLFKGENIFSNEVSPDYPLIWIWMTIPFFSIAGFVAGIIFFNSTLRSYSLFPIIVISTATIFPVIYILFQRSTLHDGWRHLIFIYPPLVILAALVWLTLIKRFQDRKLYLYLSYSFLGLSCIESTIFIAKNYQYPYVYFNALSGGIKDAYGYFETDYWGLSVKQAIDWMEEQKLFDENDSDTITIATSFYYNVTSQLDRRYRHKVRVKYLRYNERHNAQWDYAIYPSRYINGVQLRSGSWPPAETIHTVDASGIPLTAILENNETEVSRGIEALHAADWEMSISLFEEALSKNPNNDQALRSLALVKLNTASYQETVDLAMSSISITGPNSEAYCLIGRGYAAMEEFEKSKQAFNDALDANPNSFQAHFYLATLSRLHGDLDSALQHAKASISLNPRFSDAYLLLSEIQAQLGNTATAEEMRKEYLRLLRD